MTLGTLHRNVTLAGFLHLKILIGVMCLFLLSVNSWAACSSANQLGNRLLSYYNGNGGAYRCDSYPSINYTQMCDDYPASLCPPKFVYNGKFYAQPVVRIDGYGVTANCPNSNKCAPRTSVATYDVGCYYTKQCTEREVDSIACLNRGFNWVDGTCVQPIDTTAVCASNQSICSSYGGDFKVIAINGNDCISNCDLCGAAAQKRFMNRVITACCGAGKAPPDSVRQCRNTASSGGGMGVSTVLSKSGIEITGEYPCGNTVTADGMPIQENMALYNQFCNEGKRYDEPVSPGGDCDDSSPEFCGDGFPEKDTTVIDSSGMGGDFEYNYYPILDSIRDTLNKSVARPLEEIAACLTAGTCVGGGDTVIVNVPSDSAQLVEIDGSIDSVRQHIDSLAKKIGVGLDTLIDSTRKYSNRISGDIDRVGDSIGTLNDSTRKWMRKISDDLGLGTDSLIRHIDSIIKSLPDTTLDSIIKYQKYATDNFDSMLYGHGKGFALIDSLIDSTVKYLGQGFGNGLSDSIHGVGEGVGAVGDSLGKIIGILNGEGDGSDIGDGLGDTIYSGFAGEYGDTLGDGDLYAMSEYIKSVEDSIDYSKYYPGTDVPYDSAYEVNGDSLGTALQDSIQAIYDRIPDTLSTIYDTLVKEMQIIDFDSLLLNELGMSIPNTNTCPSEHFKFDLSPAGKIFAGVKGEWPLCKPIIGGSSSRMSGAPGMKGAPSRAGGLNVLELIRTILRLLTALSCIYIVMWFLAKG